MLREPLWVYSVTDNIDKQLIYLLGHLCQSRDRFLFDTDDWSVSQSDESLSVGAVESCLLFKQRERCYTCLSFIMFSFWLPHRLLKKGTKEVPLLPLSILYFLLIRDDSNFCHLTLPFSGFIVYRI